MRQYNFGRRAAQQIQKAIRKSERVNRTKARVPPPAIQHSVYILKSPSAGIPARVDDTPGAASCDVYIINSAFSLVPLTSAGQTVSITAYNISSSAVAGDTYLQAKQEIVTGKLLVDFEDCGGA